MKELFTILSTIILLAQSVFGQLKFGMSTDKLVYGYGETIKLRGTVTNTSDSVVSVIGPHTGFLVPIAFDDVEFQLIFLPTEVSYTFQPQESRRWEYQLEPLRFGLPNRNGTHTLTGQYTTGWLLDSVVISAPAYYGGQLRVEYSNQIPHSEIQRVRDSLNAMVLSSSELGDAISERWQISGFIVDSVVAKYTSDPRFRAIKADRILSLGASTVTSILDAPMQAHRFQLSQNYPNPFNPATTISYALPTRSMVTLKIFNVLGQEVVTLVQEMQDAGYKTVRFDASGLTSGIYIYQFIAHGFVETRKMLFVK